MKKIFSILFLFLLVLSTIFSFQQTAFALDADQIGDWYIKDFQSEIIVNKDSSLDITERIIADCGNLPNKHGIFRILPTAYSPASQSSDIQLVNKNKWVSTPVELIEITDFSGTRYKYETIKNNKDRTLTWKIGDADKTVKGENQYLIKYKVKNAIRFDNPNFDEFYWNLNGNFWQLKTEKFSAKIIFPEEISGFSKETNIYSGIIKTKSNFLADSRWTNANILEVSSKDILSEGEGITASVTLPKNLFTPYKPGFFERWGFLFYFLIPLASLFVCFSLWARYGRDPKIRGPIVPEFGIPDKKSPMQIGEIMTNGSLRSTFISAEIIDLAVKGILKIEQEGKKDYKLTLLKDPDDNENKLLVDKLFNNQKEVKISDLKNKFYKDMPDIEKEVKDHLKKLSLVSKNGSLLQGLFIVLAFFFILYWLSFDLSILLEICLLFSALIFIIFTFIIPKRTLENVKFLKRIDGFKLYMETAEKYRQQFNEKENIFEKYLPYAIVFGITGLWIKKMKEIYGQDFYMNYHPSWYIGAAGLNSFDADSFSSQLDSLSSNMASTISSSPSSSGSGGGGFSGGGGGGGGGGGW